MAVGVGRCRQPSVGYRTGDVVHSRVAWVMQARLLCSLYRGTVPRSLRVAWWCQLRARDSTHRSLPASFRRTPLLTLTPEGSTRSTVERELLFGSLVPMEARRGEVRCGRREIVTGENGTAQHV